MSQEPTRIATLTLSDTRTTEDDEGGKLLGDLLRAAGFSVVSHAIVREDLELIQGAVKGLAAEGGAEAIVLTGAPGSRRGIAPSRPSRRCSTRRSTASARPFAG